MSSSVPIDVRIARNHAAGTGQDDFVQTSGGTILPPDKWFMHLAHRLWGQGDNRPAKWLRYLTGFPERSCRAYARGEVEVSPLLYALIRGEQGNRVVDDIMRGSQATWWLEQQRALEVGRGVLKLTNGAGNSNAGQDKIRPGAFTVDT